MNASVTAPQSGVRTLQIVVGALALGVTVFLIIALAIRGQNGGPVVELQRLGLVTWLSLGYATAMSVAAIVIPPLVVRRQLATPSAGQPAGAANDVVWGAFATATIVGGALLEGAGFFAIMALMIEGTALALAVALVMLAGVISRFPTAGRYAAWRARVEHRQRDAEQSRHLRI